MVSKVEFTAYAGFYKEFLNFLYENDIPVFHIVFNQFGFTAVCYATDYRFIARASKKFQIKVRIIKKQGLYFLFKPILKRKGLLISGMIFALGIYVFSFLIWDIHINIDDANLKNQLAAQLFSQNIYPGAFYTEEKLTLAEKEILAQNDKLKYITLNFYKGVLECEISLKTAKEDYLSNTYDGDIYAGLAGIISDLRVYEGYAAVQLGQSVSQGDILVKSVYTDKHNNQYSSPTRAYIEAVCDKTYTVEIPFDKTTEVLTGEVFNEKTLYFLDKTKDIKLADNAIKETSIIKSQIEYVTLMGFHLPLTVKTTHYYRLGQVNITSDSLTARKIAQLQLEHLIQSDEKLKVENHRQYEYALGNNSIIVYCHINGNYEIT